MNSTRVESRLYDVVGGSGGTLFTHPHWRTFPALPYSVHASIGLIIIIMGAVAVSGNSLVVWVFSRHQSLRTPGNMLVINLALCDLLLAVCGFPFYAVASFRGYWVFGSKVCTFYGWSGGFFGLLSINTMAAIALDKYLIIVRRRRGPAQHITMKQVTLLLMFIWCYAFCWSVGPVVGWNRYIPEGLGTTCSFDYLTRNANYTSLIFAMIIGGFLIPLAVVIMCYISIFTIIVSQRRRKSRQASSESSPNSRRDLSRDNGTENRKKMCSRTEIQIAKSMLTVVVLFCLSWSPYTILSCIGQFGNQDLITPLSSAIPGLLAKASTMYNPFVYIIGHTRFKKKIPCTCTFQCSWRRDESSRLESSSGSGRRRSNSVQFRKRDDVIAQHCSGDLYG